MDFNLTREHELLRKMMAAFTENEVKPIAAETDRNCQYPKENIDKLFDLGVMGICVPKEYGGAGADPLASAICIEELSKQCASTGDIVATHNGLCCDPILMHGTEQQKAKYLPMLTTGRKVGAFCLTEPNAGSDASKGTTEAKLEGDHYVLNGSKVFITNGYVAEVFVVFAMTDKSKGTRGISAFIVESSFPGFSVGKHEQKMGLHGSPTAEIVFQDCIVPKENLLGVEGKGFKIAMQTLDGGRIGIAAQALGIAEGAMDEAKAYTKLEPRQAIDELAKQCEIAVVKVGKQGSMVRSGDEYHFIDPWPAYPIDATGAGDTYAAGFLYAHSLGMPLRVCGEVGSIIAAKVVEVIGTKIDIPRWRDAKQEIRDLIAANQPKQ